MKSKITDGEFKALKPGDRFLDRGGAEFQVLKKDIYQDVLYIAANPVYDNKVLTSIITGPFGVACIKRVLPKQRNAVRKAHYIAFRNSYRYSFVMLQKSARVFAKVLGEVFKDLLHGANQPREFCKGSLIKTNPKYILPLGLNPGLRRTHYRHVLEYINSAPDADREIWNTSIKDRISPPYGFFQVKLKPEEIKAFKKEMAELAKTPVRYEPEYLRELYQQKND